MLSRLVRITGRVQGVGYRASLQDEAERHSVTGWVRNRVDGSVEALLQGPPGAVEAVIDWARRGPPGSRVSDLAVSNADQEPAHARFELRPTC